MKLAFVLPLFFLTTLVHAQSGKIKKVQGKEATVVFEDYKPEAGERFNIEKGLNFSNSGSGDLRKRTHGMYWNFRSASIVFKDDSGDTKTTDGAFAISYAYNLGRFEFGPFISSSLTKTETTRTQSTQVGFAAQLNLIENLPGNDVIPYLGLSLSSSSTSSERSSGNSESTGAATGISAGMLWFPVSEIFSLDLGIHFSNTKVGETSVRITSLATGWRFYF